MAQVTFTKESADYARTTLEIIMSRMPANMRDEQRASANIVHRFITAAEAAAPPENHKEGDTDHGTRRLHEGRS